MQLIVQKVTSAEVHFENEIFSSIESGLLVYVCFHTEDDEKVAIKAAKKLTTIKFYDTRPISKEDSFLVISNFRILGKPKGNHVSFHRSMKKEEADKLFVLFVSELKKHHENVQTGCFGEYTQIKSTVDGPYNLLLEFKK